MALIYIPPCAGASRSGAVDFFEAAKPLLPHHFRCELA
jgi:hypothetical protein